MKSARLLLVVVALSGMASTEPPVQVSVYPRVVFAGGAVRLRCRVPRHPANRELIWGMADYRTSFTALDGEEAAVTHEQLIQAVPCEAGAAFCLVRRSGEPDARAQLDVLVSGCQAGDVD